MPIGLSIIATWTSAAAFISAPGWVYQDGLTAFIIVINIPLVMFFCSGIFVPFVYNLKITSVYEYVELRFGGYARLFVAIGFLVTSTMLVGIMALVPSLMLSALTGIDTIILSAIILIIAVAYTVMGGIKAVIWTDVSQMAILWLGGAVAFYVAITGAETSLAAGLSIVADAGKLESLDFSWDWALSNGVWVSIIGYGILHMQYFSSDQSQVQRLFTARSMKDVKYSFWFSGIVLNTQFFIFMTLGLFLYIFYAGREFTDPNAIMVHFVVNHIPVGVFGVIVSAVFAASMAAIDSLLNSMTTVYVKDIHERWIRGGRELASISTSRFVTLGFGILTAVFVVFMGDDPRSPLVALMGEYVSYLTGAMFGVFIMGMFSRNSNEEGVCAGFVAGVIVVAVMDANFDFDWGWKSPLGLLVTCSVAYLTSFVTGGEQKDINEFTFVGQRAQLLKENRIKEDGVYLLPGRFEKRSYVLLVFFALQFAFLLALEN
jgi:SSS family solute:Na+ symporter